VGGIARVLIHADAIKRVGGPGILAICNLHKLDSNMLSIAVFGAMFSDEPIHSS
jgi:hypothetical protein